MGKLVKGSEKVEDGMAKINQLCTLNICSCPRGTHPWNAIPGENNHMVPSPPENSPTDARWRRAVTTGWREMCVQLGIKHWSEK